MGLAASTAAGAKLKMWEGAVWRHVWQHRRVLVGSAVALALFVAAVWTGHERESTALGSAIDVLGCGATGKFEGANACVIRLRHGEQTRVRFKARHEVRAVSVKVRGGTAAWAAEIDRNLRNYGVLIGFQAGEGRYARLRGLELAARANTVDHSGSMQGNSRVLGPTSTVFQTSTAPSMHAEIRIDANTSPDEQPKGDTYNINERYLELIIEFHGVPALPPPAYCRLTNLLPPQLHLHSPKTMQHCAVPLTPSTAVEKLAHLRCILEGVHEFMSVNKVRYAIADGTLLGYAREGNLLTWDDDVDVRVHDDDWVILQQALLRLHRRPAKLTKLEYSGWEFMAPRHNVTPWSPQLVISEAFEDVDVTMAGFPQARNFSNPEYAKLPSRPFHTNEPVSWYKLYCPGARSTGCDSDLGHAPLLYVDITRGSYKSDIWDDQQQLHFHENTIIRELAGVMVHMPAHETTRIEILNELYGKGKWETPDITFDFCGNRWLQRRYNNSALLAIATCFLMVAMASVARGPTWYRQSACTCFGSVAYFVVAIILLHADTDLGRPIPAAIVCAAGAGFLIVDSAVYMHYITDWRSSFLDFGPIAMVLTRLLPTGDAGTSNNFFLKIGMRPLYEETPPYLLLGVCVTVLLAVIGHLNDHWAAYVMRCLLRFVVLAVAALCAFVAYAAEGYFNMNEEFHPQLHTAVMIVAALLTAASIAFITIRSIRPWPLKSEKS